MKYVGRYDNGSGWMEWGGSPVNSIQSAKNQVSNETWTDVDVVEVVGQSISGDVVAQRFGLSEWQDIIKAPTVAHS